MTITTINRSTRQISFTRRTTTDTRTPANTQVFLEINVGLDNARFDHHLAYRNVQLRYQTAQLVQTLLGLVGNNAVGALIEGNGSTLDFCTALLVGHLLEQGRNLGCLGVVDLNQVAAQRRQIGDLLLGFQFAALAFGNFFGRTNQQHVTHFALVQPLGFKYQIQCLIPWHTVQAQGDIAGNGITGHQVQIGKVGNQLQYRTHINILEVERQFLAGIGETLGIATLDFFPAHGFDADGKLVVGLKRQVVIAAVWLDVNQNAVRALCSIDKADGRGEVSHIKAHPQLVRQAGAREKQAYFTGLFLNLRVDAGIAKINHYVALPCRPAAEVDIPDAACCRPGGLLLAGYGRLGLLLECILRHALIFTHHDKQVVALCPG